MDQIHTLTIEYTDRRPKNTESTRYTSDELLAKAFEELVTSLESKGYSRNIAKTEQDTATVFERPSSFPIIVRTSSKTLKELVEVVKGVLQGLGHEQLPSDEKLTELVKRYEYNPE